MKLYDDTSLDNRGDFDDKYSEILETNLTDYESSDRVACSFSIHQYR